MGRYLILAWMAACTMAASEHHGTVKFGGLGVPGVTVTATREDKKLVAVTDPDGAYSFPDLADGVWTLQVEMLCFAPLKQEVGVAPGAPSPTWELKLLPLEEIRASAPPPPANSAPAPAPAVQQAASQAAAPPSGPAKPAKRGRKAGNAAAPASPQAGFQRTDVNASEGAAPAAANGASETDTLATAAEPSQSTSDAFIVNGSVSNGVERRAIGNARRGPGSMFRGDFFSIVDNSALNARSFSITGQDTPRSPYNHVRFGGSFGGPLTIPHLIRSNGNGQFFLNYQGFRNRNASTQSSLMPTGPERDGDLSQTRNLLGQPVGIFDPSSGLPFAGGVIPTSRISPQATALLAYYPAPNFVQSARYNYQIPTVGSSGADSVQSRLNRTLNRKDFLNGGFAYQNSRGANPNVFGFVDTSDSSGMNANINWRHMFSMRENLIVGYQFSRMASRTTPYFAGRVNVSGDAGVTGNNQDSLNWGPPNLSFSSGIAGLYDAQESFTRFQSQALSATMQWTRRPHNMTFGGDFRPLQFNYLSQQNARGTFGFTGAATQSGGSAATGSDFADFLLGIPDTSAIAFGNADKYFRTSSWDAYFADDWRVGPGLTVNVGARWEYSSPITELRGRLVNLDVASGFRAVAPVLASSPVGALTGLRYPDSLLQPDKHGIQPRVALAWHPFFGSSLVVRAGYGVYYNTSIYQAIAIQMAQQSPLSKSLSVQNTAGTPLTLANGFSATPAVGNTFAVDPNYRVGYSQNWQLSVQRELTDGMVLLATYLGIKGTRGTQVFLPNTYPAGAGNPCPSCPAGYAYMTSNGNSTRESGQVQLRRRLHSGFTASVLYTFSKALDDASLGGRGQGSSVIAQNWLNLSAERGYSGFDQRHLVTMQAQFTSGMGVRGGTLLRGWTGAVLKGWTLITNINAGTGLPLTPSYIAAVQGTGVTGSIRPDYIGGSIYDAPPGFYLNKAAYAAPAAGQWGTAGRDSIVGPSQFTLNASLGRSFERVDIRFDSTNALNHVTYPNWNTAITSGQFGLPGSANPMRTLQATLRMRF